MQSQSSYLEKSLLSDLKCPVCKEYMRPPITLCINGHNICSICKQQVLHCPSCSGQFLNTRNLTLEDLARYVKYPCKFWAYGCTKTRYLSAIGGHEVKCQYRQRTCLAAKLKVGTCSWTGSFKDMKGHLKERHCELCSEEVGGDFRSVWDLTHKTMVNRFLLAYGEIFFFVFQVEKDTFYADLLYGGPAENAAKYKYRVEFVNKDNTEGVAVTHLTRGYKEYLQDVYSSGNCVTLHFKGLRRLGDEEGKVKVYLDIIKVGN